VSDGGFRGGEEREVQLSGLISARSKAAADDPHCPRRSVLANQRGFGGEAVTAAHHRRRSLRLKAKEFAQVFNSVTLY
jgi:uncharacterized caspase-like protein